jgi:hypothetical protein
MRFCAAPAAPNCKPGTGRTGTSVGINTYRPLTPTAEFVWMAG